MELSLANITSVLLAVAFVWLVFVFARPKAPDIDHIRKAAPTPVSPALSSLIDDLKSTLNDEVVLSPDQRPGTTRKGHWAQQECERVPACVVQPRSHEQLSQAVRILAGEHSRRRSSKPLFAVRGGGHSAATGAASCEDGILIDLSQLSKVIISADRTTVTIGAGCRWRDVSSVLDIEGLAVVGGRNSDVGVGGFTLGGGISFFSPQTGLACLNVLQYEVVLASGELVTATEHEHPNLWLALKGGSNNFGIVTSFTIRCFPFDKIWSGYLYIPAYSPRKVLVAVSESIAKADPSQAAFDKHAAGPIAAFTYVQGLPVQIASVNLAYTKHSHTAQWPAYWKSSAFAGMWRIWSTFKVQSLTSATDEFNELNLSGRRQAMATITVKNDLATLLAVHDLHRKAVSSVKYIKGIVWTLVLQQFAPGWAAKGELNPFGFSRDDVTPLINISFTVNWADAQYDAFVNGQLARSTCLLWREL